LAGASLAPRIAAAAAVSAGSMHCNSNICIRHGQHERLLVIHTSCDTLDALAAPLMNHNDSRKQQARIPQYNLLTALERTQGTTMLKLPHTAAATVVLHHTCNHTHSHQFYPAVGQQLPYFVAAITSSSCCVAVRSAEHAGRQQHR
jgi:hypothetical protein